MLKINISPRATKEILKIPEKIRLNILDKIAELENLNHPLQHRNVIKLETRKGGDFRMRVGNYRVKFILENSTIKITHVQHRQIGY